MNIVPAEPSPGYYSAEACSLDAFIELTTQGLDARDIPHADGASKNIPIYNVPRLAQTLAEPVARLT